ncbi:hypothetical protein AADR41_22725 [Streptomyces sp. CLV115]|uniref:hypothetical protein n=1 Tax=Streptomyces sp. CLV115 TaxID=3138502 RepID=UPI00313E94BC
MAWDEWEQLKADAVQRHTTNMQINSASPDTGHGAYWNGSDDGSKPSAGLKNQARVIAGERRRKCDA